MNLKTHGRHLQYQTPSKRVKGHFLLDIDIGFTMGLTSSSHRNCHTPRLQLLCECYGGVFQKASPEDLSSRDIFVKPKSLEKDVDTTCAICLASFAKRRFVWKLSCNHYFHYNCIEKWSDLENYTCPMCRKYYDHP